jgi:hypothetical protein
MWVRQAEGTETIDNILASHSLNEDAMRSQIALYRTIMFGHRL